MGFPEITGTVDGDVDGTLDGTDDGRLEGNADGLILPGDLEWFLGRERRRSCGGFTSGSI